MPKQTPEPQPQRGNESLVVPQSDPELEQIESERFHELAALLQVELQPPQRPTMAPQAGPPQTQLQPQGGVLSPVLPESIALPPGTVTHKETQTQSNAPLLSEGQAPPQVTGAKLPMQTQVEPPPVDDPATWVPPKQSTTLQSLATVQTPNFVPQYSAPEPTTTATPPPRQTPSRTNRPSAPKRRAQRQRPRWRLKLGTPKEAALMVALGVVSYALAQRFLPEFGRQLFQYGSLSALLLTCTIAFLEREFYWAFAFVVGNLIAKWFF